MSSRLTNPPEIAHAKVRALYDYWCSIVAELGTLPSRRHIDPCAIPRLLENIWLVDVVGERFRFRLLGEAMKRLGPAGKVGDFLDQFHPGGIADPALDDFRFVAREAKPVWFRGKPRLKHRVDIDELERLFLPLASDGVVVDVVLCLTAFFAVSGAEI
jgi:hypothetical protein